MWQIGKHDAGRYYIYRILDIGIVEYKVDDVGNCILYPLLMAKLEADVLNKEGVSRQSMK